MRILLIDDNAAFLELLKDYLSISSEFEVVGTSNNGADGLAQIQKLQPDIVLMDIAMPQLGGFGVLEKMKDIPSEKKPQFIIITAFQEEKIIRLSLELGADFLMIKPINMNELVFNIKYLYEMKIQKSKSPGEDGTIHPPAKINEYQIKSLLKLLGVPSHVKGFDYIAYALEIILDDFMAVHALKKRVYSQIAVKFDTTPARVERVMRNAIELTWCRGNIELQRRLFGQDSADTKPSNTEFLIRLATELKERHGDWTADLHQRPVQMATS